MKPTQINGKRIALVMDVQGREVVLRGTTALKRDARHGHVLEVTIADSESDADGRPVFLISETRWRQQICSGWLFDCDYCLDLSDSAVEVSS